MEEENKKPDENKEHKEQHNFPFQQHHHFPVHQYHITDDSTKDTLSKVLRNLATTIRRQQDTAALKSVLEENFHTTTTTTTTSSLLQSTSMKTMTRSETTGGNEAVMHTDDESNSETAAAKSMTDVSACPIGRTTMFSSMKQQNTASMSASSSSSSVETVKQQRVKTLSFLHNEDLFESAGTSLPLAMLEERTTPLFRSMSFQERRLQQASLKRVESGKELKSMGADSNFRKVAILSPKHSLHELNERIRNLQQQMNHGSMSSSEFSL